MAKAYNVFMRKTYEQTGGIIKEVEDQEGNIESKKIMDEGLADIVLVKQEEME